MVHAERFPDRPVSQVLPAQTVSQALTQDLTACLVSRFHFLARVFSSPCVSLQPRHHKCAPRAIMIDNRIRPRVIVCREAVSEATQRGRTVLTEWKCPQKTHTACYMPLLPKPHVDRQQPNEITQSGRVEPRGARLRIPRSASLHSPW